MTKLNIGKNVTPAEVSVHVAKSDKEATKAKINELIQEETKLVRGIFQFFETPGGTTKITVRKYPGIEPFSMVMTDGQIYEVPLYVARFLNGQDVSAGALADPNKQNTNIGTCSYAVHGFKWDKGAQEPPKAVESFIPQVGPMLVPMVGITRRVKRFGFQSLEFGGAVS